jgi:hypothetical protein
MTEIKSDFPDYFRDVSQNFNLLEGQFAKLEMISFLQVGAYTGDASTWLLNKYANHQNFHLTDVDTWGQGDSVEMSALNFANIEKLYLQRTEVFRIAGRLQSVKATSDEFFQRNIKVFDFIYIDGNHDPAQVIKDGINGFACLRLGGVLAFDDYLGAINLPINQRPKMAIDFFMSLYSERIEVLESGYQLWIKKIVN